MPRCRGAAHRQTKIKPGIFRKTGKSFVHSKNFRNFATKGEKLLILINQILTIMGMEPLGFFGVFIGLVSFVIGIAWLVCCIVLFFKVWGMCNNVSRILQILEQRKNEG
jgi:hypothetical protein